MDSGSYLVLIELSIKQYTSIGPIYDWEKLERAAVAVQERIGGVITEDVEKMVNATQTVFIVTGMRTTDSHKVAVMNSNLLLYSIMQSRKRDNTFILLAGSMGGTKLAGSKLIYPLFDRRIFYYSKLCYGLDKLFSRVCDSTCGQSS